MINFVKIVETAFLLVFFIYLYSTKHQNPLKMKKVLLAMSLILGLGLATAQHTASSKTTHHQTTKTLKTTEAKTAKAATKLKKDGTPDKRYKENKKLKKDGTPDRRYKANK